ncbi:MAG: SDR family NAD(P)-dependent oxidoreductase [Candidatus Pacebacteria bacterium]|nr:SDR family NAD(P)-dependent oxidoreductase [Candidatus Paceibacterota bacterium]
MYEDLKDKVAIVTGARRGMGRTHALKLAEQGVKVVVSDISGDDCQKVVEEIKALGGTAIACQCDISQKEQVDGLIKKAMTEYGRLDILVNNAGMLQWKPFLELTEQDWDKLIKVNLGGYFLCSQAAAQEMAKQKSGVIVNVASIAMGQVGVGFNGIVHYCASKGGIVAMAEAMSLELAPLGIRVNTIAPGAIDTPMAGLDQQDEKTKEATFARIPLRRAGKPEEVSNAVVFLAADASSYMTGSVVIVDGGWLAG